MTSSRGGSQRTDTVLPSSTWIECCAGQYVVHFAEPISDEQCRRALLAHTPPLTMATTVGAGNRSLIVPFTNDRSHTLLRQLTQIFWPARRYAKIIEVDPHGLTMTLEIVGRVTEDVVWPIVGVIVGLPGVADVAIDGRSCIIMFATAFPASISGLLSHPDLTPLMQLMS